MIAGLDFGVKRKGGKKEGVESMTRAITLFVMIQTTLRMPPLSHLGNFEVN